MEDKTQEFYAEYKRLGGVKDFADYNVICDKFIELTLDAFVGGTGKSTRAGSMRAFSSWLCEKYPGEDPSMIFTSVDNVAAYT